MNDRLDISLIVWISRTIKYFIVDSEEIDNS